MITRKRDVARTVIARRPATARPMMARARVKLALLSAAFVPLLLVVAASRAAGPAPVVLGSAAYAGPHGAGWAKPHPSEIFNGGDPSGLVTHLEWSNWGAPVATGRGLNAI